MDGRWQADRTKTTVPAIRKQFNQFPKLKTATKLKALFFKFTSSLMNELMEVDNWFLENTLDVNQVLMKRNYEINKKWNVVQFRFWEAYIKHIFANYFHSSRNQGNSKGDNDSLFQDTLV